MSMYVDPDTMIALGKARMRDFHRERDADYLVLQARNFQPGRIRSAVNHVANFFMRLALPLEKRFGLGRSLRQKAATARRQTALRLTHLRF